MNFILNIISIIKNKWLEMKWSNQRAFATSKVVKTSFIWLIIAPITAKLFSSINEILEVNFLGDTIKLSTTLPFSWQILFFSATSFTVAGIIYSIFCPEIIKNYKNYTEFQSDGKTRLQINRALKPLIFNMNKKQISANHTNTTINYLSEYCNPNLINNTATVTIREHDRIKYKELINEITINATVNTETFDAIQAMLNQKKLISGKNSNSFYSVVEIADEHNKPFIYTSMIFYIIGFILLFTLAVENFIYVVKSIFW